MAFNSWDKLAKAQRDYPKLKFAALFVDKNLKKQPNNPYLLTWKADLALQQNSTSAIADKQRLSEVHKQPIVDTELLAYLYRISIETIRRSDGARTLHTYSIGKTFLKTWQSTAKRMASKKERIELWNLLFRTAIQSDCWDDVRYAIINYNQEGVSDKKQSHYALIISSQLAAEQTHLAGGDQADSTARLQQDVALKFMKQAWQAPGGEAIAIQSIRELRFMGEIFGRQGRCLELSDMWDEPPQALETLFDRHRWDVMSLMSKLLLQTREWQRLEDHSIAALERAFSETRAVASSKDKFWELCAWRWQFWAALLDAVGMTRSTPEFQKFISDQISKYFPTGMDAKDRPLRLTYFKLRYHIGVSLLDECKAYFQDFAHTPKCFDDLRPILCDLPPEEWKQFSVFIFAQSKQYTMEIQERIDNGEDNEDTRNNWKQYHITWLKFHYFFVFARAQIRPDVMEQLFRITARTSCLFPNDPEIACIVIYVLLNMHSILLREHEGINPFERCKNSRLLLQATMLARHIVEKDKDKQNRTLSLLAARLHLNLGLGTIAFRLYDHTKCKEMLLDTLSLYMLSRISQTHPFDAKGYKGFSAEAELERVVGAIERMERKTESYLATDIPSFKWDQVAETLDLKRGFASSLTKHLCVIERHRIARLKGESVDGLPKLDFKSYNTIRDNVDRGVFPNFEISPDPDHILRMIMPGHIPNRDWLPEFHFHEEKVSQTLYQESGPFDFNAGTSVHAVSDMFKGAARTVRAEVITRKFWILITPLTFTVMFDEFGHGPTVASVRATSLLSLLKSSRLGFQKLRMPGNTTLKPEDEPTMFHENMLMLCYGVLEVCRAIYKLTEVYKDKVLKPKAIPHPLKKAIPANWVKDLEAENAICYQTIRDVANSYMDLLKKRGVVAIKAQVRWGFTGEELKNILSDDDVEYYAQEYVESAWEAWSGVLKVKLK